MRSQKLKGIIIHKRALGEKDYAVTLLTPDFGKIRAIAKGARKMESKFTGHLDLMNVCDFEVYLGPHTTIITECSINKNYNKFREDLKKFYFASLISKILIKYSNENENSDELFNMALVTFEAIDCLEKEELIFEAFKIKLCDLLGYMPDVGSINSMKIETMNEKSKQIISFMLNNNYAESSAISLNKEDYENLRKSTVSLLEYSD